VDESVHFLERFDPVDAATWRRQVESEPGGAPFDRLVTHLLEGIDVEPLHERPQDAPPSEAARLLSRRSPGWSRWVEIHHPDPREAGRDLRHDLELGAQGAWIRFDRGLRGAGPEAGDGVRGADPDALRTLLEGVDLTATALVLDAGVGSAAAASALIALAAERGDDPLALRGCRGIDPLGGLARDGYLPGSIEDALDELGRIATVGHTETPGLATALVATHVHHDAGAHAVQEITVAAATGLTYLRAMAEAGLSVDDAARQLLFSFAVTDELFLEMAKLRAARVVWAKALAAIEARDPSRMLVHARGSRRTKTRHDPWVNLLRGTAEGLAAVAGCADAITLLGYDDAVGPAEERSRRLSIHTQILLDEEAHLAQVNDPTAGSALVETLTDRLARKAWEELQALEAAGGIAEALTSGRLAAAIAEVADRRRRAVATRKRPITGVSEFALTDEPRLERRRPRWTELANSALGDTRRPGGLILDPLPPLRLAEPYERIRDAVDAHAGATGSRPGVFLANLGPIPRHKARASFAGNLYRAGGFAVVDPGEIRAGDDETSPASGRDALADVAEAFADSSAHVAVICGHDEDYPSAVPRLAAFLHARGARDVVVAGRPGEHEAAWRESGVTRFIFLGCDVVETLGATLRALEATT
jgi:methylmalonyl-CoA mutase